MCSWRTVPSTGESQSGGALYSFKACLSTVPTCDLQCVQISYCFAQATHAFPSPPLPSSPLLSFLG